MMKSIFRVGLAWVMLALTANANAQVTVSNIGEPLTDVSRIADGGSYLLHNTGRNKWVAENAYAALVFLSKPESGPDRSMDYVFTVGKTPDGRFTFRTRRGRYIPEVDENTPLTVGSAEKAGHFLITSAGTGKFTITNSEDTRYGFDGTAAAFVGWNAAQGSNCFYEIIPVEVAEGHYPLGEYTEPDGGEAADVEAWLRLDSDNLQLSWASRDVQYARHEVPSLCVMADTTVYGWRGERVGVQAVAFSPKSVKGLTVGLGKWLDADGRDVTPEIESSASWVRYVITDDNTSCGDHAAMPTHTVPDVIDLPGSEAEVESRGVRPVWCTIEIPRTLPAGEYFTRLNLYGAGSSEPIESLGLKLCVNDHTLPEVSDWKFHLDLWQQPYSVSRYHAVPRWSDEHFEAMRPYMKALARAGQKVVTAVLFHEPWGRQSFDKFDPMVETVLAADGSWKFDFTIFDRWVEFMDECGINSRINCYSMVPWDMSFRYLDEATDTYRYLNVQTTEADYKKLWAAFLTEFASHLKLKGWFEKTAIGMDERGVTAMQNAIAIVKSAAPGLKVALAGNYHSEITADIDDYCVAYAGRFPDAELLRRKQSGQISTCYVSCADPNINLFTNRTPADAAYLPIQAWASGLDGFLHWSWLNWNENPLTDSRLQLPEVSTYTFAPGDTYFFYPGPRSSVRFERLIEGVQQAEKVRILQDEWADNAERLAALTKALTPLKSGQANYYNTTADMVNALESVLNESPAPVATPRTEYCPLKLADSKKDIALAKRYVTSATTSGCETELSYASGSPSATGVVTSDSAIRVNPGTSFTLTLKVVRNDDDLTYCRMIAGADWNRDFVFSAADGEVLPVVGNINVQNSALASKALTFSVPADAVPGESLIRIAYEDAWSGSEPDFCDELVKGFALDIPMTILDPANPLTEVAASASRANWHGHTLSLPEPASVAVYSPTGALIASASSVSNYSLKDFTPGNYLITVSYPDGGRETFFRHK